MKKYIFTIFICIIIFLMSLVYHGWIPEQVRKLEFFQLLKTVSVFFDKYSTTFLIMLIIGFAMGIERGKIRIGSI